MGDVCLYKYLYQYYYAHINADQDHLNDQYNNIRNFLITKYICKTQQRK